MADQLGDDQLGQYHFPDACLRLRLTLDQPVKLVDDRLRRAWTRHPFAWIIAPTRRTERTSR
jgi:hypothetical protein